VGASPYQYPSFFSKKMSEFYEKKAQKGLELIKLFCYTYTA
jgi:hypothetical protein